MKTLRLHAPARPSLPRHPLAARIAAAALLALGAPAGRLGAAAPDAFALRDGDRVVFYGDSITQDGAYGRLVEAYARTRFPRWDLRFYNAGVGGDRVDGGGAGDIASRLERDVLPLHPTVVTIMLGMNDGGYHRYDAETQAHFERGYRAIVERLLRELPGVRIYPILPSPFDDVSRAPQFEGGYDAVLRRLGEAVAGIARDRGLQTVDFGRPLNDAVAAIARTDRTLAQMLLPDRVHPSPSGHLVLGAALLRAWHAPGVVSRVAINSAQGTVQLAENTVVSDVVIGAGGLSWRELDRALPLPLNFDDAGVRLACDAQAGLEALDEETLQVAGLAAGPYELRIDGTAVGTFSGPDLAAGVDLARLGTPMRNQAFWVIWGTDGSHQTELVRRDLLAHGPRTPAAGEAAGTLAAFDESSQAERSKAALPKELEFKLAPAP